jgi:excisionase family DNA binding protein
VRPRQIEPMKLLTVREAAVRLGCSPALVYQLCAERRIGHVRLGVGRGTIRIPEDELEEYLKSCKVGTHSLTQNLKHIRMK